MIYDELIKLMQAEWDSVTEYSLEKVQEITNKKETLILKMQVLEENRIEAVRAIAKEMGVPYDEELTLKNILASGKHPLKPKLAKCRKILLQQIQRINELSERNKGLVDHSSLSIKKSLVFLHRSQDKAEASYYANGQVKEARAPSRMLSTEI